jgi:Domain of unknown function (DUF4396)
MTPDWLHLLAVSYLLLGLVCAMGIAIHLFVQPQKMWIMYLVWPITALFGTVAVALIYALDVRHLRRSGGEHTHHGDKPPFPIMAAKGTLHCGAGCTLGDIVAEWLAFLVPAVAVGFGWHWAFSEKIFAVWILDYLFAYAFGIAFQYFTIKPMRGLSPREGLTAAIKADTLSLTAWQVGMYGFVAFAKFFVFAVLFQTELKTDTVEFWFVMQVAMICGFVTSYPVNVWLIKIGLKEKM